MPGPPSPASTPTPAGARPDPADRFQALAGALVDEAHRRFALAELADYLRALTPDAFRRAVGAPPAAPLDANTLNYLAGAVELAAERRGQTPPAWAGEVPPGRVPVFGSALGSVRLHLLTQAPAALRRRNLFFDASFDERV